MNKNKLLDPCGHVDSLGYLICLRCAAVGHGRGDLEKVLEKPHSEEPCDYCGDLLCNRNEP